ncbi:dTMP kinase [Methanobacterium sp. ACI-7]|uniref:dTMP kinase n=1 Tax=unclassified Methanobacterium TaxID=2627676 RepID=UPI0039C198E5
MYICLEGIDGSGKSTQILLIEKWLEECGHEVKRIFEPTDSSVGTLIREMLRDSNATGDNFQKTLALLFAADRMVLLNEIEAAEQDNKIVISDRCFYSSIVYQNGPEWLYEINKHVKKPNVVILLDLDVETALSRCDGKDSFENKAFLDNIKKRYLKLAEENGFYVVNANNGVNKVHEDIKRNISPKIGRCI